jgi:hypothetical protein
MMLFLFLASITKKLFSTSKLTRENNCIMFWFYHTGSIWQQEWWWESGTVRKGSILLTVATQVSCQVFLQVESFSTTCYLINRLPSLVLDGKTPDHEILYGKIPSYSLLPTLGCFLFPFLHDYMPHKLSP